MRAAPFTLLLLMVGAAASPQVAKLPKSHQGTVAQLADEFLRARDFSGVVLMARDGHVLFEKAYGLANRELDVPNKLETKFQLGSVTKQFTAMAVMILVEREKVRLADSICDYVENCPRAWAGITLKHLLTHTSGIPSFTDFADNDRYERLPMTPLATIERFRDKPLDFAPGERFTYSNSGYLLLGYIIERASGEKYEDFLRENIYEPLGMIDSGYDHPRIILKDRASGYSKEHGRVRNATYMEMDTPFAGGSMYSTVGDLLRWDQALYTEKLISQKMFNQAFTPFEGPYPKGWWWRHRYGFGWFLTKWFGRSLIWHDGGTSGFSSAILRYPEDRTLVVVLENMEALDEEDYYDVHVDHLVVANGLSAIVFGLPPNTNPISASH